MSIILLSCSPDATTLRPPAEHRARTPRLSVSLLPQRGAERREGANLSRLRGATNHACEAWRVPCDRDARLSALHRGDFWPGSALPFPEFPPESVQRAPRSQVIVPGGRGPEPPEATVTSRSRGTPLPAPPQDRL